MGAIRDRSVLIACIGAGSAIVAAFAKPICDTLFGESPPPAAVAADSPAPGAAESPITPTPDPVNMGIVAAPLVILYGFGLILARRADAMRNKDEKKLAAAKA